MRDDGEEGVMDDGGRATDARGGGTGADEVYADVWLSTPSASEMEGREWRMVVCLWPSCSSALVLRDSGGVWATTDGLPAQAFCGGRLYGGGGPGGYGYVGLAAVVTAGSMWFAPVTRVWYASSSRFTLSTSR